MRLNKNYLHNKLWILTKNTIQENNQYPKIKRYQTKHLTKIRSMDNGMYSRLEVKILVKAFFI